MGVRLTPEETDEFLANGHTMILATIRKSGEPFMTPLWYVYRDSAFYIRTLAKSAKVQHVRRDPRACCMVEEGEKWIDLRAVIANCDVEVIEDEETIRDIARALGEKYSGYREETAKAPKATQKHYAQQQVVLKLTPREGEIRSWYNRKIRMAS